jgi:hypothetical protein
MLSSFKQVLQKYHPLLLKIALIALQSKLLLKTWNIYLILKLYGTLLVLSVFLSIVKNLIKITQAQE